MQDIYKPPESELVQTTEKYIPSIWWRVYFIFMLPLNVWGLYETFTINPYSMPLAYNLFSLIIYSLFFVCLFGLAFRRKIFTERVWFWYLPVAVLIDVYDIYIVFSIDTELQSLAGVILMAIFGPLVLLGWWAIYVYATHVSKI